MRIDAYAERAAFSDQGCQAFAIGPDQMLLSNTLAALNRFRSLTSAGPE